MLSRNEVKDIQSLCQKKHRQEEGLFIAEGVKILDEVLKSDHVIRKVYALASVCSTLPANIHAQEVTEAELERISLLETPNKVLAVIEQKKNNTPLVLKGKLSLVLDGIQDPGNLGTIIRIADWFGIKDLICSEDTVELYNPKVIQSTMGSFVRVDTHYLHLEEFLEKAAVPVFGATLDGENIHQIKKPSEGLLMIGNESKGIRKELMKYITQPITIPRIGGAESLNAGVAAGIILSHLT